METKQFDLDAAASELQIASAVIEQPVKIAGVERGSMESATFELPTVTVSASIPTPSYYFPDDDDLGNTSDGGGGNNTGNTENGSNINDPGEIIIFIKERIQIALNNPNITGKARAELERAQNILEQMAKSGFQFRFQSKKGDGPDIFGYDPTTGEIVLQFSVETASDLGLLVHEIIHADQVMNGEMWVDANGVIQGYDIWDEVKAYQIQHDINCGINGKDPAYWDLFGNPVPGGGYVVTPDDVRRWEPDLYGNLPDTRISRGASDKIDDPEEVLPQATSMFIAAKRGLNYQLDKGIVTTRDATGYLNTLTNTIGIIDKMVLSGRKYRMVEFAGQRDEIGYLAYDSATDTIEVHDNHNYLGLAALVHQLTHIGQLQANELRIENGRITGYTIESEVEAYQAQHDMEYGLDSGKKDFNGKNYYPAEMYRVTAADVRSTGLYDDLGNSDTITPTPATSASSASSAS